MPKHGSVLREQALAQSNGSADAYKSPPECACLSLMVMATLGRSLLRSRAGVLQRGLLHVPICV